MEYYMTCSICEKPTDDGGLVDNKLVCLDCLEE